MFESNNGKLVEKSAVSEFIDGSNANSGFIDQKLTGAIRRLSSVSTETLQSLSSVSISFVFLKSSTKNPVLNLDKPSAS